MHSFLQVVVRVRPMSEKEMKSGKGQDKPVVSASSTNGEVPSSRLEPDE